MRCHFPRPAGCRKTHDQPSPGGAQKRSAGEGGEEEGGGEEGASHIIVVVVFLVVEVVAITFALASVYKGVVSLANRTRYAYIAYSILLLLSCAEAIDTVVWMFETVFEGGLSDVAWIIFEDGMRVGVAFYFAYIMYSHNKSIEAPPLAIVQATTESRGGPNRNAADIAMEVYPMQPSKR